MGKAQEPKPRERRQLPRSLTRRAGPDRPLNAMQERFCVEMVRPGAKQTQAALQAGYSERSAASQASDLLKNAKVLARIAELRAVVADEAKVEAKRVLEAVGEIAFADPADAFDFTGSRITLKPAREIPSHARRAIQSIKIRRRVVETNGVGEDGGLEQSIIEETVEVKWWDKNTALANIMRHLGMLTDKVEFRAKIEALEGVDALPLGTVKELLGAPSGPAFWAEVARKLGAGVVQTLLTNRDPRHLAAGREVAVVEAPSGQGRGDA